MGLSLQDQLLKAGLVDKKQVKKAEHEKRVQKKKKKKGQGGAAPDLEKQERLKQQRKEQAERDRQRNAEQLQQAQQKADQAAAKQLIEKNKQPFEEGDEVYNYVDGGKIRKMFVSTAVADKLAAGKLAVARLNKDLVLISAETAIKVLERDENAVLIYNDPTDAEDDYPTDW